MISSDLQFFSSLPLVKAIPRPKRMLQEIFWKKIKTKQVAEMKLLTFEWTNTSMANA